MSPDPVSAAASDGVGASPSRAAGSRRVLVIGFGNTLRRDDGVGAVVAQRLTADPRFSVDDVEVQERYQLLPEMALDIGEATLVLFVDADMRGLPGSVEIHALEAGGPRSDADARAEPGASSHHVGAGELLALAAQLMDRSPEAITIGIGIADIELGEGLSPAVESAVPRVVEAVADLVAKHLAG